MRRRAKIDGNHGQIVNAFRARGCSVQSLAQLGRGVPDLLVGVNGYNVLVEVKMPKAKRNDLQRQWEAGWVGMGTEIVSSVEEALEMVDRWTQA